MPVEYEISWSDPAERLYDIEIRFLAPADRPRLVLPSWRPGRYQIENFAMNVREWSAGAAVWKDGKASWRIDVRAGDRVVMRYRYYAGVLDAGSSFLDPDEAYFNGSNLFMMVEGLREEPAVLLVRTPGQWRVETQLPHLSTAARGDRLEHRFEARDYDHLIDSPAIAAPRMTHHTFDDCGSAIHLVFLGDEGIDTLQYVEPLRAIARAQSAIFGEIPAREYRFLIHVGDRWHGVEHEDSSSIVARRDAVYGAKRGDEGYEHLLSIIAHELFHLWNVKRIVPAAFVPYDYTTEAPTRLLWAMEGVTSYFAALTMERAGVIDEQKYLDHLARVIGVIESSTASRHLSLAQASFDGWLQDPSRPHDKGNSWFSFYDKGEVIAAMLDLALRSRAGRSLDEVVRHLWSEYGQSRRGLEEDGFECAVRLLGGNGFDEFFQRYVHGTERPPYEELFAAAGVAFEAAPRDPALGAKLRIAEGALIVDSVVRGGTAMAAGLLPGDELLAIDSMRTRSEADVQRIVAAAGEGSEIEITASRSGRLTRHRATLRRDGSVDVKLRVIEPVNEIRAAWLRRTE